MDDNGVAERKERGLSEIERKELAALFEQIGLHIQQLTTTTLLLARAQTPRTHDVEEATKSANLSATSLGELGQKISVIGALLKSR